MELTVYKTLLIIRLKELADDLAKKYPDRAERIMYYKSIIRDKVEKLRKSPLSFFGLVRAIEAAAEEFPEFSSLLPSEDTVKQLLGVG